jgi:outer membrane immunogenic protein
MFRGVFAVVIAAVISTANAVAADYPLPGGSDGYRWAPEAIPPSYLTLWNGAYVGVNAGFGWANASSKFTLAGNAFVNGTLQGNSSDLNGPSGGAQVGYNFRQGTWVLGVEGDFQVADQKVVVLFGCGVACSVTETAKIDWFSTFRGRVGYLMAKTVLLYSTAGLNLTHGSDVYSGTLGGVTAPIAQFAHTSLGWVAGVGVEWFVFDRVSAKLEYLYLQNSGSKSSLPVPLVLGGGSLTQTASASNNVVRAGLNFHFSEPTYSAPQRWLATNPPR